MTTYTPHSARTNSRRTWRAAADAQEAKPGGRAVAPLALAALAAGLATLLGTSKGMELRPTGLQVAAAIGVAAAALAAVAIALHTTKTRAHLVVLAAALLSAGAAAVHFAVIEPHFDEWWAFGAFFVATGIAQLGWSLSVVTRPSRPLFWLGVVGNAAIAVLWIVTRTEGTLLGPEPHEPEPVGVADAVSSGLELAIVALALLVAVFGFPRRNVLRNVAWAVGVVTLGLTAVALLSAIGAAPGVIPPAE